MRYLVLSLGLLALLTGCLPEAEEGLSLHDVSLYGADNSAGPATLYGYFYGEPTELNVGGRTLTLREGRAEEEPLAVPSALLVGDAPYLSQPVAPLDTEPLSVNRTAFSTDLVLQTNETLGAVAYFDGDLWFTLAEEVEANETRRVVPRERVGGLFGLGALTRDEAQAFERLLRERAPVVVAALSEMRTAPRRVGGLSEYRRTALFVQEGVEIEMRAEQVDDSEGDAVEDTGSDTSGDVAWEELASGTQASGGESPRFFVATSASELESLWSLAYGNLLTPPELPEVDFAAESVAGMFLGQQSTGGYNVSAESVSLEDGDVYVQVNVTEPAQGAITTQALTHPWMMVKVGRPDLANAWFRGGDELLGVARAGQ